MNKRQKYHCWHTLDTPPDRRITVDDIDQWHKGPRDEKGGTVIYLGRRYPSRNHLPDEYQGGVHIKKLHGRGWTRRGYREIVHRNGEVEVITPYDYNGIVENHEMTWGAAGINSISLHSALEGGWLNGKSNVIADFFDLYTDQQFVSMMTIINHEIQMVPWVKEIGHNDVSKKPCPNFIVPEFLKKVGIPIVNIGL